MKTLFGDDLLNEFKKLLINTESRLWICCPYVGSLDFIDELSNGKFLSQEIDKRFITDINELRAVNYTVFQEIIKHGELRSLTGIHAKIYIVDDRCLVSSANLTETAFKRRHEIGLFFDKKESKETIDIFERFWQKAERIVDVEKPLLKNNDWSNDEGYGMYLPKIWGLEKKTPLNRRFWLKPIGVSEDPVTEEWTFGEEQDELHFAVRPEAINIGDILIAYGIGAKRILTLYEVTSNWNEFDNPDEEWKKRWKFYLKGRNLTPDFGRNWMTQNLYASALLEKYLSENPNRSITTTGGKTLGALQWKKDKLGLTPEFAQFIFKEMGYP
ncbi:MAG: phospholipase D-like domain-containing protein [bacterium]|nr:phospholipase D-like domain-containing protein [bacterium]